jgi:hypothetical protein
MVVCEVPDEEAHDCAHDERRYQLERPNAMEDEARIMGWRGFGAAIEGVEHGRGIAARSLAISTVSYGRIVQCAGLK